MTRVLAALVCLVWFASGAEAETLSRLAFAERMATAFRATVPTATVRVIDENELDYRAADGLHRILVLTSAYRMYAHDPARLDQVIQTYVTGTLDRMAGKPIDAPQVDRTRIVPTIRTRKWLEDQFRRHAAKGLTVRFLSEDFTEDLVIVYAQDDEKRMRYLLSSEDVGEREALRKLALGNLGRLLPKVRFRQLHGAVMALQAGGDYESSLLLYDKAWATGFGGIVKVDGDMVVAVPAKDAVIVTGSRNMLGLEILRAIIAEETRKPDALSATLFVYRNGRFEKFAQ